MSNCLEMSGPGGSKLAGLEPLRHCPVGCAGAGQVVGEQLRLTLDQLGKILL